MEKYINMNDSFGGKNSVSSTKSFQTPYEQCIDSLKQQVQNHKKALSMAEKLLEHYKQQNQRLSQQIQNIKQGKDRVEQKYQVLQKLFLKFDKQKQRELKKQTRKSQQRHLLEVQTINSRYEGYLSTLNQRVYLLENEVKKYQQKQKLWHQFQAQFQRQTEKKYFQMSKKSKQTGMCGVKKLDYKNINQNQFGNIGKYSNLSKVDQLFNKQQQDFGNSRAKQVSSSCQVREGFDRAGLAKKDSSLTNKDNKVFKTLQFIRMSTQDDYHSHKQDILRTVQKNPKVIATYDNFFTEQKRSK